MELLLILLPAMFKVAEPKLLAVEVIVAVQEAPGARGEAQVLLVSVKPEEPVLSVKR